MRTQPFRDGHSLRLLFLVSVVCLRPGFHFILQLTYCCPEATAPLLDGASERHTLCQDTSLQMQETRVRSLPGGLWSRTVVVLQCGLGK